MRLAVSGGGTGGHIYPAIAIIDALRAEDPGLHVLWLGVEGGPEQQAATTRGWLFVGVPAARVRGEGWKAPWGAALSVLGGVPAARHLRCDRSQVLLATGGYASVPGVVGARLVGVPVLLFLPDVRPGLAVRFTRRLATTMATASERARASLGGARVEVTGYPVRGEFFSVTGAAGRADLGLDGRPAVLVFGASQGAATFNRAVLRWAPELLAVAQIVHVCGPLHVAGVRAAAAVAGLTADRGYHLYPFLENMPSAMAAADLVVCRAGASVLGELTASGKPSLLVPYPYAGAHQVENARYLVDEGAALLVDDGDIEASFGPMVRRLLTDNETRERMAARARTLARPDAAANLARLVRSLAKAG